MPYCTGNYASDEAAPVLDGTVAQVFGVFGYTATECSDSVGSFWNVQPVSAGSLPAGKAGGWWRQGS
jgi:hypothetical protein